MASHKIAADLVGRLSAVSCKVGDRVSAGQELVVMEAMKMEIPVAAPTDGTITSILVQVDDMVEEGQVLVTIEFGFGGTFLDSSIGASAALHLAAAERNISYGCELIGGLWLAEEVVEEPLAYSDFHVHVPTRPGLGVSLDRKKLKRFSRE